MRKSPMSPERQLAKDRRTGPVHLQHRHLATIAQYIATLHCDYRFAVACHFANTLAKHNPRFMRQRFIDACR
jgi:hypothetical protein